MKGDLNFFLNICSSFKSPFVISSVCLGSELMYYKYCGVPLA